MPDVIVRLFLYPLRIAPDIKKHRNGFCRESDEAVFESAGIKYR
ncbi:hypothetical protein [Morganella morganii IS15]|nr:hypothetical protein [Morganella morganii IS15]